MFDFVIGLGQGGGRIASEFQAGFDVPTVYLNLAGVDFTHMRIAPRNRLVFEEGGTGRDPAFGEQIVRENMADVKHFFSRRDMVEAKYVLVCVGGGGGAGTGFLFPILDLLTDLKKEVFLIYTLPESREGIPTKPNALSALDRMIPRYLQKESKRKIGIMLIDNDYCIEHYGNGSSFEYWQAVNGGIVTSVKRFYLLTQLDRFPSFIDVASGYKALDLNDVRRILFGKDGYTDLRQMVFDEPADAALARRIKTSSLVFGSLDIRTTKQYVVSVGIPMDWKRLTRTGPFVEEVFQAVSKATRHTPDVIRTSYFNSKLTTLQVNLLLSGMAKSTGIEKMIHSAEKDQERLEAKPNVERLDLENVVTKPKNW